MELKHAFYSETQKNIAKNDNFYNNYIGRYKTVYSNIYKLHNSNKTVEVTCVFSVNLFPDYRDCYINLQDVIYLGIVDKWISIGDSN